MKMIPKLLWKSLAGCAIYSLILTGCMKKDVYNPENPDKLPVFDFSTQSVYTLNIKYDVPENYRVYFEVYAETPLTTDNNGETIKKAGLEPLDKGYTDANGKYSNPIYLRSAQKKVYIYSPDAGVPRLLEAEVQGNSLSDAALPVRSAASGTKATGSTGGELKNAVAFPVTTKTLGSWEHHTNGYATIFNANLYDNKAKLWGRPDYMKYIRKVSFPNASGLEALKISDEIFKTINKVLPGDGMGEVNPEVLKNGNVHISKDAEIELFFLDEQCAYLNTLAYYCYETANPPKAPSDITTQMIAFPDAKYLRSHYDYFPGTTIFDYGALLPGEGIQLHYIDKNGKDQGTKFPAGTSIGWILYANGYDSRTGTATEGLGAIYSDPKLMNGMTHVAVFRNGDFVVTSFEDSKKSSITDTNKDYKDLTFHVSSSPADAIIPEIPDVKPEEPGVDKVSTEVTCRGILTFEDNWPARGDFDMNDVVVQYISTVGYNYLNEVVKTTDKYTVLWSGALMNNSFAYQNDNMSYNPVITITGESGNPAVDASNHIVRVANNVLGYANEDKKQTFTVTSVYKNRIPKANFKPAPYNPFITINGDITKEVHLTNNAPTAVANTEWFGQKDDKSVPEQNMYYITYDNSNIQMPFAINLVFYNDEEMGKFVIPKEKETIHLYYPKFINWVQTGGKENNDWYLYPVK